MLKRFKFQVFIVQSLLNFRAQCSFSVRPTLPQAMYEDFGIIQKTRVPNSLYYRINVNIFFSTYILMWMYVYRSFILMPMVIYARLDIHVLTLERRSG